METISTINLHLTQKCNYRCKFCFAHFTDVRSSLSTDERKQLIIAICNRPEIEKINFVGGEPTLIAELSDLLDLAHTFGKIISLTTNGSLITPDWIQKNASILDILTLSIDSDSELTKKLSGRCDRNGRVMDNMHYYRLAKACKECGIELKVNTVVSRFNADERLTDLINNLEPIRWKVFQALTVKGENSDKSTDFSVCNSAFQSYIKRNREHLNCKTEMIVEDNQLMMGSYLMVNPEGCFFDNTKGYYTISKPINKVGYEVAIKQVSPDFRKFVKRGGQYHIPPK